MFRARSAPRTRTSNALDGPACERLIQTRDVEVGERNSYGNDPVRFEARCVTDDRHAVAEGRASDHARRVRDLLDGVMARIIGVAFVRFARSTQSDQGCDCRATDDLTLVRLLQLGVTASSLLAPGCARLRRDGPVCAAATTGTWST